jgi:hypothetical protein
LEASAGHLTMAAVGAVVLTFAVVDLTLARAPASISSAYDRLVGRPRAHRRSAWLRSMRDSRAVSAPTPEDHRESRRSAVACSLTNRLAGSFPTRSSTRPSRFSGHSKRMVTIRPITRRADDLMPVLRIIAGPDGIDPLVRPIRLPDPESVPIDGLRVLVSTNAFAQRIDRELLAARERAAVILAAAGARVQHMSLPDMRRRMIAPTIATLSDAGAVPAPWTRRRVIGMAPRGCDAQPPEAPQPLDRCRNGLRRRNTAQAYLPAGPPRHRATRRDNFARRPPPRAGQR